MGAGLLALAVAVSAGIHVGLAPEHLHRVLFVTIRVPLFPGTPEPVETIALVSKAVEAVGWALALWIVGSGEEALLRTSPTA